MPERKLVELTHPSDGVAEITFADPQIANTVSWAGACALACGLDEAHQAGARVAVVSSSVAGHWLEHAWLGDLLATLAGEPTTGDPDGFGRVLAQLDRPDLLVIAAIDGSTSGGGCEIGWACDLRVAGADATFAQPEVAMAITTGIGGTSRLVRLIGPTVAAEMVLDGRPVSAERLYNLGAVNRLTAAGDARRVALEWATELATRPHQSITAMKQLLRDSMNRSLDDALLDEQAAFRRLAATPLARQRMQLAQSLYDRGELPKELVEAAAG